MNDHHLHDDQDQQFFLLLTKVSLLVTLFAK